MVIKAEMVLTQLLKEIHVFPPKYCSYEEERMSWAMVIHFAFSSTTLHNNWYGTSKTGDEKSACHFLHGMSMTRTRHFITSKLVSNLYCRAAHKMTRTLFVTSF